MAVSRSIWIAPALALVVALGGGAPSSRAQNVHYQGTLRIGYSDADNTIVGFAQDAGLPRCDVLTTSAGPGGIQTLGTLLVNARGTQLGTGPGADLVFHAVGAGLGGAQVVAAAQCRESIQLVGRMRSRTVGTTVKWPGNKGAYATPYSVLTSPASPTHTYRVEAGGGIPFPGATYMGRNAAFPLLAPTIGDLTLTKGANHYGGGVPVQGAVHRNLGLTVGTLGSFPTLEYGLVSYFHGQPSWRALPIGDAGRNTIAISTFGTTSMNEHGLLVFDTDARYAFRTPGGSTQFAHGAIQTLGGGNTVSPSGSWSAPGLGLVDCAMADPVPCPAITSPVLYQGAFFAWTTGRVRITDAVGDFQTIRSASGFDVATSGPDGTTRRIQLVSPWSASIRGQGGFGLPVPTLLESGVAILTLNVIPVPEPAGLAALAIGVALLGRVAWERGVRADRWK